MQVLAGCSGDSEIPVVCSEDRRLLGQMSVWSGDFRSVEEDASNFMCIPFTKKQVDCVFP